MLERFTGRQKQAKDAKISVPAYLPLPTEAITGTREALSTDAGNAGLPPQLKEALDGDAILAA